MSAAYACDVAIVGAGPAGSSVGLQLARAGYDVSIIERSEFPRTKVCGDYLCNGAIATLGELGVAETVLAGSQPISSVALAGFGARLQLVLPGEGARSLDRASLDRRLLQHAQAAGARVLRGVYLRSTEDNNLVCVTFRDTTATTRTLYARVLIGADGAWSAVAQRNGMVTDFRRGGRWAVGGKLTCETAGHELEMYVGPEGYYARNPLDDKTTNTMLVLARPPHLNVADETVERLTGGRQRFDSSKMRKPVAIGPLRYRATRVAHGRVLLTGDAAELLDPFTGQGVSTALTLSFAVRDAVNELLAGQSASQISRSYGAHWRAVVEPRRKLTWLVNMTVRMHALRTRALRGLRRDPCIALEILSSVSGTRPAHLAMRPQMFWRLFAA